MVAESDDVAGWTADAVELLGERHAVPAACRGSASPAALAWLADPAYALAARQGERFARLFATGQIAVRLIHAVSRPAGQPMEET